MECGGHYVSRGDRKYEVLAACGKPAMIQKWQEELSAYEPLADDVLEGLKTSSLVRIEEWSYNFGPRRFLYFVRFEDSRVVKIDTGQYGFENGTKPPGDPQDCRAFISAGDRMIEVLRRCGRPTARERSEDIRTLSVSTAEDGRVRRRKVLVRKEDWVYDFGSSRFVFYVTFENGRVTVVEDGHYGR